MSVANQLLVVVDLELVSILCDISIVKNPAHANSKGGDLCCDEAFSH
jgi:hypothetical protein